ncbi:MAG: NUDIX hydrolase [Candidatus Bathyarchaeota archaeon]|nr:MAG: NUDIX hydrolase [Candidatus Bathyarchaeota archaeon]
METEDVSASGGVIFRVNNEKLEVALISKGNRWFLPKGLIEPDETVEDAALREVREETGLAGEVVKKIGKIRYDFIREKHYFKTVHFYLLRHVGGSVRDHDSEVDKSKWFPVSRALALLTYPLEKSILKRARDLLKAKQKK